jgi:hypothetical protein
MKKELNPAQAQFLYDDRMTVKKLEFNFKRNKDQDQTEHLDQAGKDFVYEKDKNEYWNPEPFSLLYGTPIWDQSSKTQKIALNHLFWVAYYSQIISAEIATIFLNQTCAAGLYGLNEFRLVCDTLDLESAQERAHIAAFRRIGDEVEANLFGERLFTYNMRPYFHETMIFQDTTPFKAFWKRLQIQAFALLSSGNAFIACQYFTVRGLRTLNGKIIQHQLSQYYSEHPDKENAPIPSKISYYHFLDESYHFNSSNLIGTDVLKVLKKPTAFESYIANAGIKGSLKDHSSFNATVNGIFWYEPAVFETAYKLFRSPVFNMDHKEALQMIERCYCHENQGIQLAAKTHAVARDSYQNYLSGLDYVWKANKDVLPMKGTTVETYLKANRKRFAQFAAKKKAA